MRKGEGGSGDREKYDLYKNFSQDVRYLREHQVLAINRAEAKKVLSVKVNVPATFWDAVKSFSRERWLRKGKPYPERVSIFESAVEDAIHRLCKLHP